MALAFQTDMGLPSIALRLWLSRDPILLQLWVVQACPTIDLWMGPLILKGPNRSCSLSSRPTLVERAYLSDVMERHKVRAMTQDGRGVCTISDCQRVTFFLSAAGMLLGRHQLWVCSSSAFKNRCVHRTPNLLPFPMLGNQAVNGWPSSSTNVGRLLIASAIPPPSSWLANMQWLGKAQYNSWK